MLKVMIEASKQFFPWLRLWWDALRFPGMGKYGPTGIHLILGRISYI